MRALPPGRRPHLTDSVLASAPVLLSEHRSGTQAVTPAGRRACRARPTPGLLASELSPLVLPRHYPFVAELLRELARGGARPSLPLKR